MAARSRQRYRETRPRTEITAEPGVPLIQIVREFDAPPELVFRAFTEPELLQQWLGPYNLTLRVEQYELRDGGRWRFVHTDAEGNEFGFHGVFHGTPSVQAGAVRTFEYEGVPGHVALETASFEPVAGGRTLVRRVSSFQSQQDRDGMVASGMETGVLEGDQRLAELLARLQDG